MTSRFHDFSSVYAGRSPTFMDVGSGATRRKHIGLLAIALCLLGLFPHRSHSQTTRTQPPTAAATTTSPDHQALPAMPTPSLEILSSSEVKVSWDAVTNQRELLRYDVERCVGKSCNAYVKIGSTTQTNYDDAGLDSSSSYSYRIRPIYAAGRIGAYSPAVAVATPAITNRAVITITSPKEGVVVPAGKTFTLTSSFPAKVFTRGLAALGSNSIQGSDVQIPSGSSMSFQISVPANAMPGIYRVTVMGMDSTGTLSFSAPLTIHVEPTDVITGLDATPELFFIPILGDTVPLTVMGTSSMGGAVDLTRSVGTSFVSSKPDVAIVRDGGMVAIGPGDAQVAIKYGNLTTTVSVSVPHTLRGDLNGDGIIDQSDLDLLTAAWGSIPHSRSDQRDLNSDGAIDYKDSAVLQTLCTHAGCTPQ